MPETNFTIHARDDDDHPNTAIRSPIPKLDDLSSIRSRKSSTKCCATAPKKAFDIAALPSSTTPPAGLSHGWHQYDRGHPDHQRHGWRHQHGDRLNKEPCKAIVDVMKEGTFRPTRPMTTSASLGRRHGANSKNDLESVHQYVKPASP